MNSELFTKKRFFLSKIIQRLSELFGHFSINKSSKSCDCLDTGEYTEKVCRLGNFCCLLVPRRTHIVSVLPKNVYMSGPASPEVRRVASEFISFLNKAVTPFHAVQECKLQLEQAGFLELPENGQWNILPSHKYFVTKNRSAIMAFAVGGAYKPGGGFSIVVGHTDSPCLRVKPVSKQQSGKFLQIGVSTYGGGIWRTWFDRDLSVAGEIVIKKNNQLTRRLINIRHPILFIPNLAIHLTKDRDNFSCNTEEHLRPILETYVTAGITQAKNECIKQPQDPRDIGNEHHSNFLDLIAKEAEVLKEDIVDMDLFLYDTNPAASLFFNS